MTSAKQKGRARYRRILRFALWHLTVTWWYEIVLPSVGLRRIAARTRPARMRRFAKSFRVLAVALGGLMIKLGQYLSSRLDVLPAEITSELQGLQDEVPPVSVDAIKQLAEAELGVPLGRVFAYFDEDPVAAASLGQAHRARLTDDDAAAVGFNDVVVKVQRPGIAHIVDVDLAALRKVAVWVSRVRLVNRRVDAPALLEEFAVTSLEEIDYLHEGAASERFAALFEDDPRVRVPAVVWERTTRRVLTLEDVSAIKITDHAGMRAAGIEPAEVAPVFAEVMFDQLFQHGYFHADPHPGNLFVIPLDGDGPPWALTVVDFGMMGEVTPGLKAALRKLVIAAALRDGKAMVAAMSETGVLLPSADFGELERIITHAFARFGGMGFAELRNVDPREFREFAAEFSDIMLNLPFQLPANYLLIMRTTSLTSGVCSGLDPAYNLWDSVEPYAQRLLRDESGGLVGQAVSSVVDAVRVSLGLPARIDAWLTQAEGNGIRVEAPAIERALGRQERVARRQISAVLFAALFVGGAVLRLESDGWGTAAMVVSALPLLHSLVGRRR